MTGQRIHRLLKLVKLLQSGRAQTTRSLADACEVSRRTVFRDLELLRQSEIGIEFDDERQSFVMNGCRSLPATTFTAAEALAVLALCYHVGNGHGLPFFEDATSAALKIESNLPQHLRDELSEQLWSLELSLAPLNQLTGKRTTYQAVVRAVARKRSLRIRYFDVTERREIATRLNPYRVFFIERCWYVIGRSSIHRAPRTFNLDRIRELEELDEPFKIPRGFSLNRYLGNAWRMIPERGKDQKVKARFAPLVAHNVAEVTWHKTQKTRFLPDGSLQFEVRVSGIREISWWLLGYGDQVEVISPKPLRALVQQRLGQALAQYEQVAPARVKKVARKPARQKPVKQPANKKPAQPSPKKAITPSGGKRAPRKSAGQGTAKRMTKKLGARKRRT